MHEPMPNAERNAIECRQLPAVLKSKPVVVFAELSTHCDIHCPMCTRNAYDRASLAPGFMERRIFERLTELLTEDGRLAAFGRGESLLHPEALDFLGLAKSLGATVTLNTNGQALTPDVARGMVALGQDNLVISCSAGRPETYESIHSGGSWDRLWGNIAGLLTERGRRAGPPGERKPRIQIEFVSQTANVRELPELVERALRWDLDGVLVVDLLAHTDAMRAQQVNTPENIGLAEEQYGRALAVRGEYVESRPDFVLAFPSDIDPVTKKHGPSRQAGFDRRRALTASGGGVDAGRHFCLEPWQTFFARYDGTVGCCCITQRKLGDLNTQTAGEIWNGPGYRDFRQRMRSEAPPFECTRCPLLPGPRRLDQAVFSSGDSYPPL